MGDKPQGFPDHPLGQVLSDEQWRHLQQLTDPNPLAGMVEKYTDPGPLERAAQGALGGVLQRAGELLDPSPLLHALHLYDATVGPEVEAMKQAQQNAAAGRPGVAYVASPQMKFMGRVASELFGIHDAGDAADRGMPRPAGVVHVPMPGSVEKNKAPF